MFVQIMEGRIRDADLLKRQTDRWHDDLRPGAVGYLGSTSGVTADGTGILVARFEDEAAARENSARPEQSVWWSETTPAFEDVVLFHDSSEVDVMFGGGSDSAGFVQVIQGRAVDPEAMRGAAREMEADLRSRRPDVLGGIVAWHGDREFTQVVYFTSEADARAAETPFEEDPQTERWTALFDGPPAYLDLREPQFD